MVSTILLIALAIIGGLVITLFGVVVWARRGERRPDANGVRTVAVFAGGEQFISAEERQDEQVQGTMALGGGLLAALVLDMKKQGLEVAEPDRDDYGWGVTVRAGEVKAYLQIGATEDAQGWTLIVVDPSSGGPGPPTILPSIDAALKALPGLSKIAWHRRDRFLAGDLSSASQAPIG